MKRTPGDDVDITVRVRKSNMQALLDGVALGVDDISGTPITLKMEPIEGENVFGLAVTAGVLATIAGVEPVDVEIIGKPSEEVQ